MHFGDAMVEPNVMYLTEHFARYAALAPWVRGRRVLDIACGEGYGSWLLKEWGASSVLGVDVSEEAIRAAQGQFACEGVQYLAADACEVANQLAPASFDLIVSFETIEHVLDPERFLAGLRLLAAPGAQICISAPNDHVSLPPDQCNPYHLRKYTFEEFKACSEAVLGPASDWLLGTNVQGYALVPDGSLLIQDGPRGGADIVRASEACAAHLLPSQDNIRPNRVNVLYYVGVWGEPLAAPAVAISAQSYQAFIEPWQALDWFKAQQGQWLREQERTAVELIDMRRQIVALNGVIARLGSDMRDREVAKVPDNDHRLAQLQAQYAAILQSRSWRLTRGMRVVARLLRGELGHVKTSFVEWRRKR